MSTEIRLPIVIKGWIVMRDLRVVHVEIDRTDWAHSSIPYVTEYQDQTDVMIFRDLATGTERIEADVDIVIPVQQLIHDLGDYPWKAGVEPLESEPYRSEDQDGVYPGDTEGPI